ncbi:hypothetical protein D9M68_664600 [compost metagenome]
MGEAQQPGQFLAQDEDLGHHRAVVVLPGIRALVGGTGAVGGVDLFAQGAVIGVGHHRVIAGEFQGDQPAAQPLGLGGLLHLRLGRVGQAGQRGLVMDFLGPGLGGVEQLVGKAAAQLGQLHLDLAVALLLVGRQVDAGQAEVTQGVVEDGLLRHLETGGFGAAGQGLVGLEQRAVLAEFGPVLGQLGQAGLVGGAQLGVVAHRVEVAHRAPGPTQALAQFVQRQHQPPPGGGAILAFKQFGDGGAVVGENLVDGRFDMFRTNGGVGRQVEVLQEGIAQGHGIHLYSRKGGLHEETRHSPNGSHLNYNRRLTQPQESL